MMVGFEEFKDIVWSEFKDAAGDAGGTVLDEPACRACYETYMDGDWHRMFDRNYCTSVGDGFDIRDPDHIAHFESNYFLCARMAGKRAARKAPGGQIAVEHFKDAIKWVYTVAVRAKQTISIQQHLCS